MCRNMHLGVKEQFTRAGPLLSLWVPGKGALSLGELEGKYFMEEERIACPKVQRWTMAVTTQEIMKGAMRPEPESSLTGS